MADAPTWSLMIDASSKVATIAALGVGSVVGYGRYVRGRVWHAKCDLQLAADIRDLAGREALQVTASVKNDGTCQLVFPKSVHQQVQVSAAFDATWKEACHAQRQPQWSRALFHVAELLTNDKGEHEYLELEPGQQFSRTILIPVPSTPPAVAFRVVLYVEAEARSIRKAKEHAPWSTDIIVVKG